MNKEAQLLRGMKPHLNKKQYALLENMIEAIYMPTHIDKSNDEVIRQYLEHYVYLGNSAEGAHRIGITLKNLANGLKNTSLIDASYHDLNSYLINYKRERGVKERTLNVIIAYIRGLYSYLFAEEWITTNPMLRIERHKELKEQADNFTEKEIKKLRNGITDYRDRAILEFLLATGCRRSEIVKMKLTDVDFKNKTAKVRKGKGGKDRTVFFDDVALKHIKKYLSYRALDDDPYLFTQKDRNQHYTTYNEKPLKATEVTWLFEDYGKQLEVGKCHPHKCRHYCITKLIRSGMRPELVKTQAGHASVSMTIDTYTNVVAKDVETAYRKAMA